MKTARLTGYVYIDLATNDYGGYVEARSSVLDQKLRLPPGYTLKWSGEYEFQLRARKRLSYIMPIVFGLIFVLLYMLFHSAAEAVGADSSRLLRDDWRFPPAVPDGLQFQRRGMGRLHRSVRNRSRNRRRDGDLSARSPGQADRRRRNNQCRTSKRRASKARCSDFGQS